MRFLIKHTEQTSLADGHIEIEAQSLSLGPTSQYPDICPGLDFDLTIRRLDTGKLEIRTKRGSLLVGDRAFKRKILDLGVAFDVSFFTWPPAR